MKAPVKITSFGGNVTILGKERRVDLEEPIKEGGLHTLSIAGVSPDDADAILTTLSAAPTAAAKAETAPAGKAAPAATGKAAPAAAPAGKAPATPAPAKATAAPAGKATPAGKAAAAPAGKAAPAKGAKAPAAPPPQLDMPGGDDEEPEAEEPAAAEEPEAEEPAAEDAGEGEGETHEERLLPNIPENITGPKAKMMDVVAFLNGMGYATREHVLEGCLVLKESGKVPILTNMEDVPERLERTFQVMGYKK